MFLKKKSVTKTNPDPPPNVKYVTLFFLKASFRVIFFYFHILFGGGGNPRDKKMQKLCSSCLLLAQLLSGRLKLFSSHFWARNMLPGLYKCSEFAEIGGAQHATDTGCQDWDKCVMDNKLIYAKRCHFSMLWSYLINEFNNHTDSTFLTHLAKLGSGPACCCGLSGPPAAPGCGSPWVITWE